MNCNINEVQYQVNRTLN